VHWIPNTWQPPAVVDRFADEAQQMGMRWVVFLNDGADVGDNDYLVRRIVQGGMMPVMRVLTHRGAPLRQDVTPMARHYRALGVRYFQLYNEPNLPSENQDQSPSVARYLDLWLPAARQVVAAGGLPGLGALSPDAEVDDVEFLRQTLREIKRRGELALLDRAWVGVHNYLLDPPGVPVAQDRGFRRAELYDRVIREELGRPLPLIGTEGGLPADRAGVQSGADAQRIVQAFELVRTGARPYELAYTYWLIANEEGGGGDPVFRQQALFRSDGPSPLVSALKRSAPPPAGS
jgi:hypothetical protein